MEGVKDAVKPTVVPSEANIYGLIGEVTIVLKRSNLVEEAHEFVSRAVRLTTYDEVLDLCRDYVRFYDGGSNEPATYREALQAP